MKNKILQHSLIVAIAGVLLAQAGFAQAPNGTITSQKFSGVGKGLYDLTGVITDFGEDFVDPKGEVINISEDVNLLQAATGALSANGTTTTVTVAQDNGSFSFAATYTLKGALTMSGMSLVFAAKGSSVSGGVTTRYNESLTYMVTVNPVTGAMSGRKTGSASQSGANAGTVKLQNTSFAPELTPVDWQLNMTLATSGTKVTSTAANVTLANGRVFPFNVKGTYTVRTGVSKLTLTGTGTGKGATLTVTMAGNSITGISGSLLGQPIKLNNL